MIKRSIAGKVTTLLAATALLGLGTIAFASDASARHGFHGGRGYHGGFHGHRWGHGWGHGHRWGYGRGWGYGYGHGYCRTFGHYGHYGYRFCGRPYVAFGGWNRPWYRYR